MFNKKRYKHKQSGYSTIMLVPTSTSKVWRLQIPHWFLYAFFSICLLLLIASVAFSLRSHQLQKSVTIFSTDLEESIKVNEEMESEAIRLSEQIDAEKEQFNARLKEERERSLQEMQREKEGYINSLEYYEDRLSEFQDMMDELDEATQKIYDKLGRLNLPTSIQNRLIPMEEPSDANLTFLSMTYNNEDVFAEMDNKILDFETKLQEKKQEFDILVENAAIIKPYLDAIPSIWPVRGRVTSEVGTRPNPFSNTGTEGHSGIDIAVPTGTSVKATAAGKVTFSGWQGGYGYVVKINHGYGITTVYAHNSRLKVSVGESVTKGQEIAKSGNTGRSTGPHVHYEVLLNGVYQNPRRYLP